MIDWCVTHPGRKDVLPDAAAAPLIALGLAIMIGSFIALLVSLWRGNRGLTDEFGQRLSTETHRVSITGGDKYVQACICVSTVRVACC